MKFKKLIDNEIGFRDLTENAGISRIWQYIQSHNNFAIIGTEDKNDGSISHESELREILKKRNLGHRMLLGEYQYIDSDTDEPKISNEHSYIIHGLSKTDAIDLGKKLNQESIIWKDDNFFGFILCDNGEELSNQFSRDANNLRLSVPDIDNYSSRLNSKHNKGQKFQFRLSEGKPLHPDWNSVRNLSGQNKTVWEPILEIYSTASQLDERFEWQSSKENHYYKHVIKGASDEKKAFKGLDADAYEALADELANTPVNDREVYGYTSQSRKGTIAYNKWHKNSNYFVVYKRDKNTNEPLIISLYTKDWREYNSEKSIDYIDELPDEERYMELDEDLSREQVFEANSTSRIYTHMTSGRRWAIISPYKTDPEKYGRDKEALAHQNHLNMNELKSGLRAMNRGYYELMSKWVYENQVVNERSLFIIDIKYSQAMEIAQKYGQCSFIYCEKGKCREICATPYEDNGKKYNVGDSVQEFNVSGDHILNIEDAQKIFDGMIQDKAVSMVKGEHRPFTLKSITESYAAPYHSYFAPPKTLYRRIF